MDLSLLPLLFGLLIAPAPKVPVMPYIAVPVVGWNDRIRYQGGGFIQIGATALPLLRKQTEAGLAMQSLEWRPVGLVGLGYAFNGDLYLSAGAQVGYGCRPYASVGVRFWPFFEEKYARQYP